MTGVAEQGAALDAHELWSSSGRGCEGGGGGAGLSRGKEEGRGGETWTHLSAHGAVDGDDDETLDGVEHGEEDLGEERERRRGVCVCVGGDIIRRVIM